VPKHKDARLSVFKGREARLNLVIFTILDAKKLLTSYDMYLEIRRIKGFRHTKYPSVDRRMKALHQQHWITRKGTRRTKPGFDSPFYELSSKGRTAIEIDRANINDFLKNAEEELLLELRTLLSSFRESRHKSEKLGS
jgi:DNA-binding PadR family transcriptional regulator